jgi:hypothetical protein
MNSLLLKLIVNLITIAVVIASIDDMKIIRTDMSEPMRRHAMGEALLAIEKETNKGIENFRLSFIFLNNETIITNFFQSLSRNLEQIGPRNGFKIW